MSALGSSVINKSSKKFGPKQAPIRRVATSTQTSARPSVDRQIQSQTPQPQPQANQLCAAATPTPSVSIATPVASKSSDIPSQGAAQPAIQKNASAVVNSAASQGIGIPQPGASRVAPQVQSAGSDASIHDPHSATTTGQALEQVIDKSSVVHQDDPEPTATDSRTPRHRPEPPRLTANSTPQHFHTPQSISSDADTVEHRAAKRRRVDATAEDAPPQTSDAATNIEDALPSTEPGETTQDSLAGPAAPSHIFSQPIRQSIERAQPAKIKKPRTSKQARTRKRANQAAAEDVVADATGERPRKTKRTGKARSKQPAGASEPQPTAEQLASEIVNDAVKGKKPRKKHKRRESTPEDAEDIEIVPSKVTMSELTGNVRTGSRSSRDKELQMMQEADKDKKKLARKKAREGNVDEEPREDGAPVESAEARLQRLADERHRSPSYERAVPNTIIVNGQIQLDESSLVIDRHARAARDREEDPGEVIEENDNTRRFNCLSFLKVDKSGGWNEALTDQFYDGLRMFGTDFYMISKMFPGRTRHSVKLKFNKEERLNAWRIESTLKGEKLPVDMDEFAKLSNTVFSDPAELEREMAEDRKKIEEVEARAKADKEEAEKERADQAAREAAAEGEEHSAEEAERTDYVTTRMKKKALLKTARENHQKKKGRAATGGATSGRARAGGVTS